MKPIMTAAVLAALAAPAVAQEKDPFKDFQYGHRVEIILRSGFGVLGKLHPYTEAPANNEFVGKRVELAKTKTILLDMSLEYPEMGGRLDEVTRQIEPHLMGFERNQVKSVRRLPDMTPEEVKARMKAREEALARILAEESNRRQAEQELEAERKKEQAERDKKRRAEEFKDAEGKLKQAAEKLQRAREAYEKYPPPDWSPEKLTLIIKQKSLLKQQLSPEEQGFQDALEDWLFYKNHLESQDGPKVEPPKTEEPPKPKAEEPPK